MSSTYINLPIEESAGQTTVSSGDPSVIVDQVGNDYQISIDQSSITAEQAASVVNVFTAGETLSALQAVYYHEASGTVQRADSSILIKASSIGVTKTAANLNTPVEVVQYGLMTDLSFSYLPSDLIFLDSNGVLTTTAPSSGYLTRMARAITSDTILILIESPVTL